LFSRFERVIDRRTLSERRDMFNAKPGEEKVFVKKQSKFLVSTEKTNKKPRKERKTKAAEEPAAEAPAE
jgi:hypothetical protein